MGLSLLKQYNNKNNLAPRDEVGFMIKRSRFKVLSLTLALLAGLSACDSGAGTDTIAGPQADYSTEQYTWGAVIPSTFNPVGENVVTAVIGRSGGIIRNGDHSLMIPQRAVESETEFTFVVKAGDHVEFGFSAKRVSDGAVVSTFPVSLTLRVSYKNINVSNPYALSNAYKMEGAMAGYYQKLPTSVSTFTQTLSSPINHFSEYLPILD